MWLAEVTVLIFSILRSFLRSVGGNVTVIFALAAPALIGVVDLSVDYVMITDKY